MARPGGCSPYGSVRLLVHAHPSSRLNSPRVRRRGRLRVSMGDMGSGRLRVLVAAAAILATSGCGPDGRRRPHLGRAEPPTPRAPPPTATASHGTSARAGQGAAAPQGRAPADAGDAGAVHAVGAHGLRHRRLPLLPARPEAGRRRLDHRHQRAARQPGRRAPRHPVPGPAGAGRAGEGARRRHAGRGLDLLRRHRPRRVPGHRRRPVARAPGRPAARSRCNRAGYGVRLDAGLADRDAGALQPARRRRARTSPPPSCGWRRPTPT